MSAAPRAGPSGASTAHSMRPAGPATNSRRVVALNGGPSKAQPFDHAAVLQVLLDDLVDVRAVDVRVPDRVRVDHHARTFLAAVEATRLVDPDLALPGEPELLDALLGVIAQLRRALGGAARTVARLALVAAEEDVLVVIGHRVILPAARGEKDQITQSGEGP